MKDSGVCIGRGRVVGTYDKPPPPPPLLLIQAVGPFRLKYVNKYSEWH